MKSTEKDPRSVATAALASVLATPTARVLLQAGQGGLAKLLDISKQTMSAAIVGTDPLSYRIARRLARVLALKMHERAAFLAAHVRAMSRPMIEVEDLDHDTLCLIIETVERHRDRVDAAARRAKERGPQ